MQNVEGSTRVNSAFCNAWPLFLFLFLTLLASDALAHPGIGIVRDRRGNIFYTDLQQVWKIAPDGTKSIAVRNVHTHELCLDGEDNLFGEHLWYEGEATNQWGHRVWRRGHDGSLRDVIPSRRGFLENYSFVRDALGTMYWSARGVIQKRAPDGVVTVMTRSGMFRDVRWMTAAADGTLYLVDGRDVRKISSSGTVTTLARNVAGRSLTQPHVGERHLLMGLWLDPAGSVLVAAYGARQVKRITPGGVVTVVARSPFPWSPTGGLFDPDGDLWLLETSVTNAVRVRRIRRHGGETIY